MQCRRDASNPVNVFDVKGSPWGLYGFIYVGDKQFVAFDVLASYKPRPLMCELPRSPPQPLALPNGVIP